MTISVRCHRLTLLSYPCVSPTIYRLRCKVSYIAIGSLPKRKQISVKVSSPSMTGRVGATILVNLPRTAIDPRFLPVAIVVLQTVCTASSFAWISVYRFIWYFRINRWGLLIRSSVVKSYAKRLSTRCRYRSAFAVEMYESFLQAGPRHLSKKGESVEAMVGEITNGSILCCTPR